MDTTWVNVVPSKSEDFVQYTACTPGFPTRELITMANIIRGLENVEMKVEQLRRLLPSDLARGVAFSSTYTRVSPGSSSVQLTFCGASFGHGSLAPTDNATMLLQSISACGREIDHHIAACEHFESTWGTDKQIKFTEVQENGGDARKMIKAEYGGESVAFVKRAGMADAELKIECIVQLAIKLGFVE